MCSVNIPSGTGNLGMGIATDSIESLFHLFS